MDRAVLAPLLESGNEKFSKLIQALKSEGLISFSATIFIEKCRQLVEADREAEITHVLLYLASLVSEAKVIDPIRRECPQIVPGLAARPVWDTSHFPWLTELEASTPLIQREFLALKGQNSPGQGFQRYSDRSVIQGDWNVCYLYLHNVDFKQNRALCPHTTRLLSLAPRPYGHAFFSALAPGTALGRHCGPTNKKLRCFLPLFLPPDAPCHVQVLNERVELKEGRAVVFDDSFPHSAANPSPSTPRVALIFDFYHPQLSEEEVRLLGFLLGCQVRSASLLHQQRQAEREAGGGEGGEGMKGPSEGDDFLSGILRQREKGIEEGREKSIWS